MLEMSGLREKGIYRTPDGIRLVASRERVPGFQPTKAKRRGSGYSLFSSYSWAFHGPADYVVSDEGEVIPADQSKQLKLEELADTGWTAGSH
jgi:hypothetical protein